MLIGNQRVNKPLLLLDTHVWIWLEIGHPSLSKKHIEQIDRFAKEGVVLLPAISVWEVAMLEAKGRITLTKPCKQWVTEALNVPGITLAPLTPEIALESCKLPGEFHNDPADQMIVATARIYGARLITYDRHILAYAEKGYVRILEES